MMVVMTMMAAVLHLFQTLMDMLQFVKSPHAFPV